MEEGMISGMKKWREAHPKATLCEIERELDERLAQLRAKMLAESAMMSEAGNWQREEAPLCPACGQKMEKRGEEKRGEEKRRLKTGDGKEIELKRHYASCPACGAGFFPLDEELELLAGNYTPHAVENLVRLSAWMPFGSAVQTLAGILRVQVSKSSAVRMTEAAGAAYVSWQNEVVAEIERTTPLPPDGPADGPAQAVISADGAMVPLLQGQWSEVKTLVISEVAKAQQAQKKSRHLTYFSRLASAEEFTRLA